MDTSGLENIFNSEDAIFLAAMIFQSYQLFEKKPFILPKGYELRYTICALAGVEEPEAEVFGFIAESQDEIVIAFRGTRTFKDNESDQDLYQVPYRFVRNAGKTHRGFTCIYQSTRDKLIRELNKISTTKRLFVAGHSLGGALAVLAAIDIAVNTGFKNPIVYTYGSPRVGDPVFASRFNQVVRNSIRIVNVHDIIPTLPDREYLAPFTKNGLFYQHVNTKVPLSFQLNSLPVRNHEIVCYFRNLSTKNPDFAKALCVTNQGFCPDTEVCVPFKGVCSETVKIRNEKETDYESVEEITRKSFWNLYMPGCNEHYLVHIMRSHKDFLTELDLVIEVDDQIIGNIMYTKAKLVDEHGAEKEILTFGPVCIIPEYQRMGYGKMLIEHSFELAVALGYDVIVIFGVPSNYVSLGFKSCKRFNICLENGTFPAAMMVKELKPEALDGRKWVYYDSPVMSIDEQEAQRFEEGLEKMEKKFQPSQEEFYILSHSIIQ